MLRALDLLGYAPSSSWLLHVEQHFELLSAAHNLVDLAMADAALAGLRARATS
jgi:hypothetical protein